MFIIRKKKYLYGASYLWIKREGMQKDQNQKILAIKNVRIVLHAEDDNDSDDIATLVEALKQKHGNAFSIEQYNAWAQLINLGKHASTEEPPQYPFFVGRSTKKDASSSKATATFSSSGERIHLRTELLDQMQKLSNLLERGDI